MIQFQNIVKRFRRHQVLKGIDLTIERGHRVALVGSNGAGKTTLIRCLLGEYICEGRVLVEGMDPRQNRRAVLAKVGFVPQLPPPLHMPVGQLIRFSATLCDSDPTRMIEVAEQLGFDAGRFRKHAFVKLSGGQKQKLLIAIALGRESELLVMDEPAANLDPEARHIFFELLAEKKERAAMLISSHRLDEVATLVNRVIEMDQGEIVLDDRVADLIELSSKLSCTIRLLQPEAAFAKAITEWGFSDVEAGVIWQGAIAGPDRLRFLSLLSRYAALLSKIEICEAEAEENVQRRGSSINVV
ncbi:MAG: ABC transporter [gamma proteobacterium symbiont of Ctena orbiculata]|uniref:ABC transporter ATP-binding protein n=1 Tax=Candidatus Thiodiazotropha taylori TaxID=2792791 RepID=A0A944QX76_9GAMM|nr:ABC transporter ATP-binding protein [Candidatus Thiodiazotropha taylori]PUB89998.1 MAG: ABC transporter ATP-binding protein [gamma proteobacterium symbiont of Ctena orbiculata]MBT2991066.1 ABC transporter ATP-binding protein [Candidatus Thiodiazotropha taylori]MBT2996596.1 ABC transporter ATP-binding protein [Candidatus Thiodiazotropha taylori]MBT3000636.1 ABC transporter ATP-binding protein [Candidatus Thiodiazotropha taylori]